MYFGLLNYCKDRNYQFQYKDYTMITI